MTRFVPAPSCLRRHAASISSPQRRAAAVLGAIAGTALAAAPALAQAPGQNLTGPGARGLNLDAVTLLARGAVQGQNVATPVRGFELVVMHQGRLVYQQSFGDWSNNRVANADSATKTLSGGLIMSLTERSARPFSLDTRVGEFVPTFTGAKAPITIRQAFSHTSGLPGSSSAVSSTTLTLQQAAAQIGNGPLPFPPGTRFSYGGVSMHAAGAAAETAGGASWNTLFDQRIRQPLGLSVTRFVLSSPTNPRIAGGCESNGIEFSRFMEMLRRGGLHATPNGDVRVLSQASVTALFTRQTPPNIPIVNSPLEGSSDYGVGVWLDRRAPDGRLLGAIAAGARGFCSWVDFDPQLVGAFSTDISSAGNVTDPPPGQPTAWLYLVRAAAEQATLNPTLLGDADSNGLVNLADLQTIATNYLRSGRLWSQGDFNGDGLVNAADLELARKNYADPAGLGFDADFRRLLRAADPCVAVDLNESGSPDADDLSDCITAYFAFAAGEPAAPFVDYNGDGAVNTDDLSDFIADYYACP